MKRTKEEIMERFYRMANQLDTIINLFTDMPYRYATV